MEKTTTPVGAASGRRWTTDRRPARPSLRIFAPTYCAPCSDGDRSIIHTIRLHAPKKLQGEACLPAMAVTDMGPRPSIQGCERTPSPCQVPSEGGRAAQLASLLKSRIALGHAHALEFSTCWPAARAYPKVFSALYVMYRNPSSALYCSYTSDMRAPVFGDVLFTKR